MNKIKVLLLFVVLAAFMPLKMYAQQAMKILYFNDFGSGPITNNCTSYNNVDYCGNSQVQYPSGCGLYKTLYNFVAGPGRRGSAIPDDNYYCITNQIWGTATTNANANRTNGNQGFGVWYAGNRNQVNQGLFDHTTGGVTGSYNDKIANSGIAGNFIVFNAAQDIKPFFFDTIWNLCAGTDLYASIWAISVIATGSAPPTHYSAKFIFQIEDLNGNILKKSDPPIDVPNNVRQWKECGMHFKIPYGQNAVVVKMINAQPLTAGNDIAFDDLGIYGSVPMPTPASVAICEGKSIMLDAGYSAAGDEVYYDGYQWIKDNVEIYDAIYPTYTITNAQLSDAGSYWLRIKDCHNDFLYTSPAVVTVNPLPIVQFRDTVVCLGTSVTYPPFFTTNNVLSGYTWTNNNTSIGLPASGIRNLPTFTATNTGTAKITVTATSSDGCSGDVSTTSFNIIVSPCTLPVNPHLRGVYK